MNKGIPLWIKVVLTIIFPPLIIFWIILYLLGPSIRYASNENKLFAELVNNPSKEKAEEYIALTHTKPVLSFLPDNNPSSWAILREKWQIINHSNKVPTQMKKEIFEYLVSRCLYVSNSKIVDNYKENN